MRADRQRYQQQTAESEAGIQIKEQRQAEEEFNRQQGGQK